MCTPLKKAPATPLSEMSIGSSSKSNQGGSASSHSLRRLDALEADFKAFRRRTNERLGELENCVEDVKALVDNLLPNQEKLQTYKELQDDTTPVSGSRGASASSCRQQTSRTRTLTTIASLLLILSAQICVFDCMNMMSRVRPRICGLYTTKTCHLQTPNGLTLQGRSDRRCCRQHAESSGNRETPPLMTFLQMPVLVRPRHRRAVPANQDFLQQQALFAATQAHVTCFFGKAKTPSEVRLGHICKSALAHRSNPI